MQPLIARRKSKKSRSAHDTTGAVTSDIEIFGVRCRQVLGRALLRSLQPAVRQAKCPVLVAKLDRLSRDVAFIAGLMAQRSLSSSPSLALMQTHLCCTFTPLLPNKNGG